MNGHYLGLVSLDDCLILWITCGCCQRNEAASVGSRSCTESLMIPTAPAGFGKFLNQSGKSATIQARNSLECIFAVGGRGNLPVENNELVDMTN